MNMDTIIETKNLTKKFGNFTANDHIDLAVKEGEIRAIIGENGAGKSTLMNMLYGILQPTEGEILFRGKKVAIASPRDAIELGIGMVHQHFKPRRRCPSMRISFSAQKRCAPIKSEKKPSAAS